MAVLTLFDPALLVRPEVPALEARRPDGTLDRATFGELEVSSNRLAHVLHARGLGKGDRLAVLLPNGRAFVEVWLACIKLGAAIVPVNVLYRAREIAHVLADASPVAVVTTEETVTELPAGAVAWPVESLVAEAGAAPAARPAVASAAEDLAALVYTSGTTGRPKGAMLTQGNFVANTRALLDTWAITSADRYLAVLPLFHVHGLANGLHCWLASGCHMRLLPRFEHARAADEFLEYRPTLFFGVPTIYVRLLDVEATAARRIGDTMRLFVSGSAPLPATVLEVFATRFGHVILERYGMSETLMLTSNPLVGERRPGTVGRPLPHVDLRIVDEQGQDVEAGRTGEIWVRGPNVCRGYWRAEEATRQAFHDGWFRTGDAGERSRDGYVTLRGRLRDLIITGGFNVYPREIEEVLLALDGVREAAVVGAPDRVRGEVPVAYVVADPTVEERAMRAHLERSLASFKVPRAVVRVQALPRNALGKVQKDLLPTLDPR